MKRDRKREAKSQITVGLDLGERRHRYCALGKEGEVLAEGSLSNTREGLSELSEHYPAALVVMEAGSHSPWVSRYLAEEGCEVIVSNPRRRERSMGRNARATGAMR